MKAPKELRKLSDGRIFAYTEALASRSDMVAVWHGEEPEHYEPPEPVGLRVSEEASSVEVAQEPPIPDADRMKILTEKTVEMLKSEDSNDFTGQGIPRVERLRELSGLSDITPQERNAAYKAAKDL